MDRQSDLSSGAGSSERRRPGSATENGAGGGLAPGPWRRLAAMLYDSLLLIALWMAAGGVWLAVARGVAPADGDLLFRAYLLLVAYLFFGLFWTRGGRTLGMQAWRLRAVTETGKPMGWRHAAIRYAGAWLSLLALGSGYLWCLVDRDRRTWHERLSGTRTIVTPGRRRG